MSLKLEAEYNTKLMLRLRWDSSHTEAIEVMQPFNNLASRYSMMQDYQAEQPAVSAPSKTVVFPLGITS